MFIAVFVLCVCLLILVVLSLGSGMCVLCGGARASLVAVSRLQSMRSVVVARGLGFSAACGIPVPRSGIEPISPAVRAWSLNHWTTRVVLPTYVSTESLWLLF